MKFSISRRFTWAKHKTRRRAMQLPPAWQAIWWMVMGGVMFSMLNTIARFMALQMDPFEAQFLRYLCGLLVILPLVLRSGMSQGFKTFWPTDVKGQFWRGAVHTGGLMLWFIALPKIPLADMTAISFTGPIFIMMGASFFLNEPMHRDRWIAALIGFAGVLVVLLPNLSGDGGRYHLVMLASAPVFAASFLITKALTRYETPGVIVLWQAITVTLFSMPMAFLHWQTPTAWQWVGFIATGILGSAGHYFLTRAFQAADISSTQSLRFLDLVWSSLLGWFVFSDLPSHATWLGAFIILMSTVWITRREGQRV
jgi:drug/metabolite transporter (DMT)-like permease